VIQVLAFVKSIYPVFNISAICTKKADVANLIEANQIPSNYKSLVPPLINTEIWSYLYRNVFVPQIFEVNQSQPYLTQLPDFQLHNSERARLIPKYYHHRIDYNQIHQIVVDIHQYVLDFELS
jgi:hypothetical protein